MVNHGTHFPYIFYNQIHEIWLFEIQIFLDYDGLSLRSVLKIKLIFFCTSSHLRRHVSFELKINPIVTISLNVSIILQLAFFSLIHEYHSATQLILIKLCPVSLQGSNFASTCLELVKFFSLSAQLSLIPTNPSQLVVIQQVIVIELLIN